MDIQIDEASQFSNGMNPNRNMPKHIINKISKVNDKENFENS